MSKEIVMFSVKNLPDDFSKLKEVNGYGYEMLDVVKQVQEMMKEYRCLEVALDLKAWGKPYERPPEFRRLRMRAARSLGYAVNDVKQYLADLEAKIVQMRAKLDIERDKKNWNQEWYDEGN